MKNLIKKIFSDRRVRFLFVGVLNTIVGYGCFAGAIFFGLHYVAAQAVASVFAILHSYLWNKYFTFKVKKRSLKEFGRFVLVYFLSYLINLILLFLIVDILKINVYIAGLICLVITVVISYIGHKKISFVDYSLEAQ